MNSSPSSISSSYYPQGTQCQNVWFSRDNIDCPNPLINIKTFPKISIIGSGIAGLTIAYELVRAFDQLSDNFDKTKGIDITIYERASFPGGKIVGYFRSDNKPVEHSTRVYGIGYVALYDIFKNVKSINPNGKRYKYTRNPSLNNARTILDDLIPMSFNYVNASTFTNHYVNIKDESPFESTKSSINLLLSATVTTDELKIIISKFQAFYNANYAERIELTAGYTIGQYLEYNKLSAVTQAIINSYIGIIVAARVQCDAFAIMSLFESLGLFGSPKTSLELKNSGIAGASLFPGPSSKYFIEPLCEHLKSKGVKFVFNYGIENLYDPVLKDSVVCICTPHMVTSKILGPNIFPPNTLRNEWSFGVQHYITDLNDIYYVIQKNRDQNVYSAILGGPWQIVYTVEYSKIGGELLKKKYKYKPFWGTDDMGTANNKPILAVITTTISNQYNSGIFVGKPVLECTPNEIIIEILFQINLSKTAINIMKNTSSFGSILYISQDFLNNNPLSEYNNEEWMKGPLQSNNYRWISDYTLYIATPNNPTYGSRGMCSMNNMYQNSYCFDMNYLPDRLNESLSNSKLHYLGIIDGDNMPKTFDSVPDNVYIAGEFCSTPNFQIPTMSKACESGKVAAQRIIADYGLTSQDRINNLENKDSFTYSTSLLTDSYVSASTLTQVEGLEKTSDLIDFVSPSTFQTLLIKLYVIYKLYNKQLIIVLVILLIIIICIVLIYKYIHNKKYKNINKNYIN